MSDSHELDKQVTVWLTPLPNDAAPCGPDLEYDNTFLDLDQAAKGKPEDPMGKRAAEPPNWRAVRAGAESMFEATRDLRVAILWLRATVNSEGFSALAPGLRLVAGLLGHFWDQLHPRPDPADGDLYARINALTLLRAPEGLLGDLRGARLADVRGVGELRVRDVEVAVGILAPRDDEVNRTRDQVKHLIGAAIEQGAGLRSDVAAAQETLRELIALLDNRMGVGNAPDLRPLQHMLDAVESMLPPPDTSVAPTRSANEASGGAALTGVAGGAALAGAVTSRADAARAIDLVCEYLERAEPSSPAQLLLRRAQRLLNHNFLLLVKELAPEALNEVARVMGVDPGSVQSHSGEG